MCGPTPTQELQLLEQLKNGGANVKAILDEVAQNRVKAALAFKTNATYASHVRMIEWACSILGERAVPAETNTIIRVSSLVNNPNTLRGWLAAWRAWHIQLRRQWQGDKDPILRSTRAGTLRIAPLMPQKGRMRFRLWLDMLRNAALATEIEFGAACNFSYMFALRVPSELLKQFCSAKLRQTRDQLHYGGIRRKGKSVLSFLSRWCVCQHSPLCCWHLWLAALTELRGPQWPEDEPLITMSGQSFTKKLREALMAAGVAAEDAGKYTTILSAEVLQLTS